jgi:8-oxo-dGTP diphosphatase
MTTTQAEAQVSTEIPGAASQYWTCTVPGARHWGNHGAAGVLPYMRVWSRRVWVAMAKRSPYVQDGNTWAGFGGAIDAGETAWQAAKREAREEAGLALTERGIVAKYRDYCPHGCGWSYTTYVVKVVPSRPKLPRLASDRRDRWETSQLAWVPVAQVKDRPLHPGYARTVDRNLAAIR